MSKLKKLLGDSTLKLRKAKAAVLHLLLWFKEISLNSMAKLTKVISRLTTDSLTHSLDKALFGDISYNLIKDTVVLTQIIFMRKK